MWSGHPAKAGHIKIDRRAPMIGEHNELVFKTFLPAGKKEQRRD